MPSWPRSEPRRRRSAPTSKRRSSACPRSAGERRRRSRRPLRQILDAARKEAEYLKDEYVSTEHLFLAMLKDAKGEASRILRANGVDEDAVLKALAAVRGSQRVTDPEPEGKYQVLEKYARDLTALARQGKLDPVIGREDEIRRVIQVLSRRTKNNPVLIGEAGRRQDGRRRGPGPAHRQRRRAPVAQEQAPARPGHGLARRRDEVPGRVRGPAQGRAQGDRRVGRPGGPLHRRAPHHHGRRGGRGGHGRLEHAQAGPGPRRAPLHRRDHPQRVQEAHREGRRPGAALPAGLRRRALGRGDRLDPARPQGEVRGPPRRPDQGLGPGRGGDAVVALHHQPVPAGQGHRPRRRGRLAHPHPDRQPARGARRARPPDAPARDRAPGPEEGEGPGLQGAAGADRGGAGQPQGEGRRRSAAAGRRRRRPSRRPASSRRRWTP